MNDPPWRSNPWASTPIQAIAIFPGTGTIGYVLVPDDFPEQLSIEFSPIDVNGQIFEATYRLDAHIVDTVHGFAYVVYAETCEEVDGIIALANMAVRLIAWIKDAR